MSDFVVSFSGLVPETIDLATRGVLWRRVMKIGAALNLGNFGVQQIAWGWESFSKTVPPGSAFPIKYDDGVSLIPSFDVSEKQAPVLWMIATVQEGDGLNPEILQMVEAYVFYTAVLWSGQVEAPTTIRDACRIVRQIKKGNHARLLKTFTKNMTFERFLKILQENNEKYRQDQGVHRPSAKPSGKHQ
ncbi:hypothetical protein [Terasakiella sp. SH-1]|uniref:hypothetical protein n=1 Tax=Terasakiella sp. SH-1 TaxID=2560057 RepID=UPI001073F0A7|nr:hypothetical protein [Terasakiella sp. SH-1]